ncbi:GNAT family N-acetyltransferase [Pantoea sp. Eser]|nr:GNAT family N-acetyltransferase [Pantoea sp. Eser]
MNVHVRTATAADTADLFHIRTSVTENALSYQELQALGITPAAVEAMISTSTCAWIALSGRNAVGFSMILPEEGCLFAAFVLPAYQGAGIGKRLAEEAENQLFLHHDVIWLETAEATRAAGFYRHRGWVKASKTAADNDIRMVKQSSWRSA